MIAVDADTLLALLEHELQFFVGQTDPKRQVLFVGRLLQWLEREPRLSALLDDAGHDEAEAALVFRQKRGQIHGEIARLWDTYSTVLKERLASEKDRPILEVHGPIDGFESRCTAESELIDTASCPQQDKTQARKLIDCLRHWNQWTTGKTTEGLPEPAALVDLTNALEGLDQREKHAFRQFQAACRYLPGAAFKRLRSCQKRVECVFRPSRSLVPQHRDHLGRVVESERSDVLFPGWSPCQRGW